MAEGRAIWFEGPRQIGIRREAVRDPEAGQVTVRAIHSLISAGSELNLYRGEGNLPDLLLPTARGTIPFPLKFAYQTVGEVAAAGSRSGFAEGDRVFARHPHQDLFTIEADGRLLSRIPADIDSLRAQFAGMFNVALQILLQRPVRPGEVVAVSGLGLVGSFAAFLARLSAGRLIAIDPLPFRRERAQWIGADALVHPRDAAAAIDAMSGGRGADLFIETSGAPPALQTAIASTAVLGTIAVAAWYGTRPVPLSLSPEFHLRSQKILSIHVSNLDEANRWDPARKFATCCDYLKRIDVERLVTHRFAFDRAPDAFRLLDEKPGDALGVLLVHE